MHTPPDKTIAFTYGSHPMPDPAQRWTAVLTFPPGATAGTTLALRLTDGNGAPVARGVFELAGQRLEVRDGAASVGYATFVGGQHETALWLHRPGMPGVPGGLTFA